MENLSKNNSHKKKVKIGFRYLNKDEIYNKCNCYYIINKKTLMYEPLDGFIILIIGKDLQKNSRLFEFSNKKIILGKKIGSIDKINIEKKDKNNIKKLKINKNYFNFTKIKLEEEETEYNIKTLIKEIKKEQKFIPKNYNISNNNCYNFIQFILSKLKIKNNLVYTKSYEYSIGIRPLNIFPTINGRKNLLNLNAYHTCIIIGENIYKNAYLFEFNNFGFRKINNVSLEKNNKNIDYICENFNEFFFDFNSFLSNIHGYTLISPQILEEKTKESKLWEKEKYNFIHHNCQHYINFCLEIIGSIHRLNKLFYNNEKKDNNLNDDNLLQKKRKKS